MHVHDREASQLAFDVFRYATERMRLDPPPLDHPRSADELNAAVGVTITEQGLGGTEVLRLWEDVLSPACLSVDHPRFLAFVPAAPTEAATLFDLAVSASSVYPGSWLEGAGAVFAENQALRWICDLVGLGPDAGGVFVSGGTAANLSGLIAARHRFRERFPEHARTRMAVAAAASAHSSIAAAARVMDVDVVAVEPDERGRLTGPALRRALDAWDGGPVCAVVATAGATNSGLIDDLAGAAALCTERDLWFHVDGAYGGAGLCVERMRSHYAGIERADSFLVDPHKWLFAPFDCAALVYADPLAARRAHTQHAEYLDVLTDAGEWNPSDFAHHLSRRARGLPFWFSLAAHGTQAYGVAVDASIRLAEQAAEMIREHPTCELVLDPELSIVMFRRVGWTASDYQRWSDQVLRDGLTLTVPTSWLGETVLRWCFVNPRTTTDDLRLILDTLL
jgi:L-2,4-diaminobutyrate decarboxylase